MPDNSIDNKRIAKNTIMLYGRMLYSMLISLYTARVLLNALGFEDYGLYNVIGSVVSMFVFLRSAMGNSVHRFITFAIGKEDSRNLNNIFSMTLIIHTGLAILIILLCETIGLWFLNTHIEIPFGRVSAANWVYQFVIISCAISVICVPYDAEIIAHEKMGVFAVIQILNSTLNLGIALAIKFFPKDKLILYAFLMMLVQIINRIVYGRYCRTHFEETKFHWTRDAVLFREVTGFAGWSLIGNIAYVGYTQGINILLNLFFGTVVNAARGIAIQVQNAIKGFVTNFQMSVNPQITKSYAREDFTRLHELIYTSSKLSFFLLYCLALPMAIECKTILSLWLKEVPDYTVSFTILTLFTIMVDPLSNPLNVANNATGKIKVFQIVEGGSLMMILPIAYFVLKEGGNPISVFIVQMITMYVVQFLRILLVCNKIKMSIGSYFKNVLLRVSVVAIIAAVPPMILFFYLPNDIWNTIVIILVSVLSVLLTAYLMGLNVDEKTMLKKSAITILIH